ncbi:MAG: hypothetical protein NXI30_17025 [bacterium]|nr:hypothetical protein [bacterium]
MNLDSIYTRLPVSLQHVACTWAGWQRSRARFTPYFHRTLAAWMKSGTGPREELHRIQLARLLDLLQRARDHVPYYRDLALTWPSPDGDPEAAIRDILDRLPILEKSDYRASPERFLAEDVPRDQLVEGKTSGTTGTALPLWWTPEALAEEFVALWRGRMWAGIELYDRHLTFGGQILVPHEAKRPPFWRYNAWNRQTLFSLYHMTAEHLPHYIDAIHRFEAAYVQGYPSSLHLIARAMLEADRPLSRGRLKAVLTSSESLLAFQRASIEDAFGAPIVDRYGSSEFVVSMASCPEGRLHVDMEFGLVEVEVEEETEDYVRGPLLVTGLSRAATPFVRYRIGDVATRSKHACPCGRPGDAFLEIDGRVEDYVVTPDGRFIGRLDHVFKEQLDVAEAQVLQASKDAIDVLIVPRGSWDERSEASLIKEFRSRLGEEIRIDLRFVAEIPREANGKFRAVKSSVGRNQA